MTCSSLADLSQIAHCGRAMGEGTRKEGNGVVDVEALLQHLYLLWLWIVSRALVMLWLLSSAWLLRALVPPSVALPLTLVAASASGLVLVRVREVRRSTHTSHLTIW